MSRFKQRQKIKQQITVQKNNDAISDNTLKLNSSTSQHTSFQAIKNSINNAWTMPGTDDSPITETEIENLLKTITNQYDENKFDTLLAECHERTLEALIRPFGLGRILFENKDGGNVDTVHNARNGIYATQGEKNKYDNRPEYDSHEYHSHSGYVTKNRKDSAEQKAGTLNDGYTNESLTGKTKNLDHVISASEIANDAGRVLAEKNGADMANKETNLVSTDETINKSKQHKTVDEFITYKNERLPQINADIDRLASKTTLSEKEKKKLATLRRKKKAFEDINEDKIQTADKEAREAYNNEINKAYYGSKKFAQNLAKTNASEAGKMGLQQALGLLLEEFVRKTFFEIKDIWDNGFTNKQINESFFSALKTRLMRIAKGVMARWKDAITAFKEGAIAGFFSNIITVIINMFKTTLGKFSRMIREGFLSFLKAIKLLLFPPEHMTRKIAAHEATKILVGSTITAGSILLEEAIEQAIIVSVPLLIPFASLISGVLTALTAGLCTAFAVYMLDKLDLFNVEAEKRHSFVMDGLQSMIDSSYERALMAAETFAPPKLLHLEPSA